MAAALKNSVSFPSETTKFPIYSIELSPSVRPGLPDGLFAYIPKIQILVFLVSLEWKILVYFIAIWHFKAIRCSLRPFGIFCSHLV
jgi:hypothetical protein